MAMTVLPPLDPARTKIVPLPGESALAAFYCGEPPIDEWVEKCVKHEEMHRARIFCAIVDGVERAYGFYALSLIGVEAKGLGSDLTDHVPHSGTIPFVYIDYLAVEKDFQNKKLGTRLFFNALARCEIVAQNVGYCGVALHSLTARTTKLYAGYGFKERGKSRYLEYPLMVLPVQTLLIDMRAMRERLLNPTAQA